MGLLELLQLTFILIQLLFQWLSYELIYDVSKNSSIQEAVVRTDQLEQIINGGSLQQCFVFLKQIDQESSKLHEQDLLLIQRGLEIEC